MDISALGPPGCGKGTQAKLLAAHFGLQHFSLGEILRMEIDKGTPLGQRTLTYVKGGSLVPDSLVIEIFESYVTSNRSKGGFVFDGYPRTLDQAVALDKILALTAVVNYDVSEDEILDRVAGRVIDEQGRSFHLTMNPPPPGVSYKRRPDDQPEIVRKRFREYLRDTTPIFEHYQQRGILITVDATGSIGAVLDQFLDKLAALELKSAEKIAK
jgi:adenylate kinase